MKEEIMAHKDLQASLRGTVIGRDDEDYDEARKLYNSQ
jgi:hypothetical protein